MGVAGHVGVPDGVPPDAPAFTRTIPVLRSFDEAKAREFYLDFLGFTVDFEHRFAPDMPLTMGVSRGELRLHISEHFGDAMPGSCLFIEMTGLRAFQAELAAKRFKFARPGVNPGHSGGRTISLDLTDPFGNRLRFEEREPAD